MKKLITQFTFGTLFMIIVFNTLGCSTMKVLDTPVVVKSDVKYSDSYSIEVKPFVRPNSYRFFNPKGKEMDTDFYTNEEIDLIENSFHLTLEQIYGEERVLTNPSKLLESNIPVYIINIVFTRIDAAQQSAPGFPLTAFFSGSFIISDENGYEIYNQSFDLDLMPLADTKTYAQSKHAAATRLFECFLGELAQFDTQLSENTFDIAQSEKIVYVKWTPKESVGTIYFPSYISYTDASSSIDLMDHGYKIDWGPFSVTPYFLESIDDLNRVDSTHLLSVFENVSSTNSYIKLVYPIGKFGDWIVKPIRSWYIIPMEHDNPQETGIEWMLSDNILKEFIKGEYEGETWLSLNSNNPVTGEAINIPMFNHDGAQYFGVSYFEEGTDTTSSSISKISAIGSQQGYLIISVYQFESEQMTFDIAQQLYSKLTENFESGVPYFRMGQKLE